MTSVKISPTFPTAVIPRSPHSASAHVIRSRLSRFYPESQVEYSYNGNNEMVWHISSPTDFADFTQSYIRCKLTCSLLNNGADDASKYLAEGGIHSLFSKVEIYTRAGVLVQRIEEYNKLYQMMSSATMSRDFVTSNLLSSADSADVDSTGSSSYSPLTYTTADYDLVGGAEPRLWTLTGGVALGELAPGDCIVVEYLVASVPTKSYLKVQNVIDNNNFRVTGGIAADVANADVLSIRYASKCLMASTESARRKAANTANYVVTFNPFSSFLNNGTYIPLFLIRGGLRIVFTLGRPEYALCSKAKPVGTGFSGANCVINTPEWMVQMYQPDESLSEKYLELYRTSGLNYFFPSYRHYLDIVGSGASTEGLNHHVNTRSIRGVYQKIQDERANTVTSGTVNGGKSTYTADSISQGLKAKLETYHFTLGSLQFPESSPINVTSPSNAEPYLELQRSLGQMGGVNVFQKRFQPYEWEEVKGDYAVNETGNRVDSQRLILSAMMERDPSPFSGVDGSLVPLQSELKFASTYELTDDDGSSNNVAKQRYIHSWIISDALLNIGEDGVVLRT